MFLGSARLLRANNASHFHALRDFVTQSWTSLILGIAIENKFSFHAQHSLRYHEKKRPKQNKYLVCLGRTNLMSVVPPSFMVNKTASTMLSPSRNEGLRQLLLVSVQSQSSKAPFHHISEGFSPAILSLHCPACVLLLFTAV